MTSPMPIINHRNLLQTLFLLWLMIFTGCREKQFTKPTPQMDAPTEFWIRVLLLDNIRTATLKITSPFTISGLQIKTPNQPDTPVQIQVSQGKMIIAGQSAESNEVIISPDNPYIFNLDGNDYRGKLKLTLNPDCNSFDAINLVPLEPYLAGVIGAEMPGYWEPEALKAQAIAARTYCLYIKRRFGPNRSWDVTKTQANQIYLGVGAESNQVWNAVNRTAGDVLVCTQPGGEKGIFPAYYSSICGGHTENSSKVFGDSFAPLAGVPCPYCREIAKPAFFFWDKIMLKKTDVSARLLQRYPDLKLLGEIKNIVPIDQSDYDDFSRLTTVKLFGPNGKTNWLRAEDLRLAIDPTGRKLKSAACQITDANDKWAFSAGRGFGHAVGLCQCGAQAMARKANTAAQILVYYYPGSDIKNVY